MITRTRYKENYSSYSNKGKHVNIHRRYVRYKSGSNWVVSDKTDANQLLLSGAPQIIMMEDQVPDAIEKKAIKITGRRELRSKKCLSWKSNFETFYKTRIYDDGTYDFVTGSSMPLVRVDNSYLPSSRSADFCEYRGLPNEARTYWTFIATEFTNSFKRKAMSYDLPIANVLSSYQKMCKDANMLNLHDQNLFTTIGELKDFRKTVQTVTKHVLTDKKYIADKYLGVNFGIIPFYSDMKNYVENYNNFAPNLKKWNDLGIKGKVLNKHRLIYKDSLEDKFSVTTGTYLWPSGVSMKYVIDYKVKHNIRCLSHLYFRAKPLKGDNENALIASINGLSKPFTAAWNLIPFSFLVDWFVNVGDMIDTFEYQRPVVSFDILDTCYSIKFDTEVECDVYHYDLDSKKKTYLGSSKLNEKFFRRVPKDKKYISDVIFNSVGVFGPLQLNTQLSGYQMSLAAALAVTNIRTRK